MSVFSDEEPPEPHAVAESPKSTAIVIKTIFFFIYLFSPFPLTLFSVFFVFVDIDSISDAGGRKHRIFFYEH